MVLVTLCVLVLLSAIACIIYKIFYLKNFMIISAVFKGRNGSLGFITGRRYKLEMWEEGDKVYIAYENVLCPYSSHDTFYENWEVLEQIG